tara:strand:+ start:2352 stop:3125 length:774 start_codon:yes stop_codon:yes gene_type:complete
MQELRGVDDLASPAEVVHQIFHRAGRALGVSTPYEADQKMWVEKVKGAEDSIRADVEDSGDPFLAALKLSVAANLIDCEFRERLRPGFSLKTLLEEARELKLVIDQSESLRQTAAAASRILFVHETAGELFFDRLLIETLGKAASSVTSVLRSAPSLGGALEADALNIGLEKVATLTDPGVDCRGLLLGSSSDKFIEEYEAADLVIAKGQAAFETLEEASSGPSKEKKAVFFLLRVRCAVIAGELGVSPGDCVVERH